MLKTLLTSHLHGPNNRKANYFPSMPLSGNLKAGVCGMPSANISSISQMPRHCYLLMPSVICIISMWQMGMAHSFPKKMNLAFKGAGGHSFKRQWEKKINKSNDIETKRSWGRLVLATMWAHSSIRVQNQFWIWIQGENRFGLDDEAYDWEGKPFSVSVYLFE